MILSKSNIQVLHVTKKDSDIPVLDNVHIRKDGTTVGAARNVVLAVSPVTPEWKKDVPLAETQVFDDMTLSSEGVKAINKYMPKDTMFHGLLEHCDVQDGGYDSAVVMFTDGKRNTQMTVKKQTEEYIPYDEIIGRTLTGAKTGRIVINAPRLILLLDAILRACPDPTTDLPVYVDFTEEQDIVVRAVNPTNGQRALGVMKTYKGKEAQWLDHGEWERSFIKKKAVKVAVPAVKVTRVATPAVKVV